MNGATAAVTPLNPAYTIRRMSDATHRQVTVPMVVLMCPGNVWEWTATRDNSHDRAYVLRGGSWYNDQSDAHVTARIAHNPLGWYPVVGFRLVDRPPELPLPLLNYLLVASNV